MKVFLSTSNLAQWNLALETTILKDTSINEDVLLLYVNKNCIVIGRNQNLWEEINYDYVKEYNINLVRRISGGGAVYQDENNICFSFITNLSKSYADFLKPVIKFFKSLGLDAHFYGKNDVLINGFKVSGNAQYKYQQRMFQHGTILFKTDMKKLGNALKPNQLKMESKGIKSVRQRVANIYDLLTVKMTAKEFAKKMINFFKQEYKAQFFDFNNYQPQAVKTMSNFLSSKEWIYNKNPEFKITAHKRFLGGTIKLSLNTKKNLISDIKFSGDFLSAVNFEEVYKFFIGQEYEKKTIVKIINKINNFEDYFGKITKKEVSSLFF